jgi:chromosome segregation ATPase
VGELQEELSAVYREKSALAERALQESQQLSTVRLINEQQAEELTELQLQLEDSKAKVNQVLQQLKNEKRCSDTLRQELQVGS